MSIHVRPLVAWQLGGYLSRVCECVASHTRTSQIFHKHKVLSQSAGVFETHDLLGVCEALCVGETRPNRVADVLCVRETQSFESIGGFAG